jgi:hypothetical protein
MLNAIVATPAIPMASQLRSFLRRKNHKVPAAKNASAAPSRKPRRKSPFEGRTNCADCAVVASVNIVLAALPLGVTVCGLKLHVTPFDWPLHAKLTCWLNPFTGVTVIDVCADVPAVTDPLAGAAPIVKLGTSACTVTLTALEVDPEKFESPL